MKIDVESGLLNAASYHPSHNMDERPEGEEPSLIVIHGISLPPGEFGGNDIDALFTNRLDPGAHPFFREIAGLRVSTHFLVRRNGEIVQYVPVHKRAWHAGVSSYKGREACNDFSVGIELEGTDEIPYEESQYQVLAELAACLIDSYPALNAEDIAGHSDIAPGRKTDPGPAFRWDYFRELLRLKLASF